LLESAFEESAVRTGTHVHAGLQACVVPHAGPMYSGVVAAAAYRALARARPERIVLLGFSHRGGPRGIAWPDEDAIATPLGAVSIDREFLEQLSFCRVPEAAVCDHSVEIQLPFLQRAVPGVPVAPLYVSPLSTGERKAAAEALLAVMTPGTVLIASSDFTHYGREFGYLPFPADDHAPDRIRELDLECIHAAGSLDPEVFLETIRHTRATVCGYEPIALLLEILHRRAGVWQEMLDYQASGEITGDWRHSVSYAALGYVPGATFQLDVQEQEALLQSAEAALEQLRITGRRPAPPDSDSFPGETRRGVFVSLHRGERLLGCVGNCASRPLALAVPELTLAAALDDPRFRPAARLEGEIEIEISVLSPMRQIKREQDFQVGRHGGQLSFRDHRALLLPQVAKNRGWTSRDFLDALAHKAGLKAGEWRNPEARLWVFEAQVFSRRSLAEDDRLAPAPDEPES